MRALAILFLALTVALSGVTMASARHQARAADLLTLCTGIGLVVLAVDEQGNPVGPMLPCPECTPPLLAVDGGASALPAPALRLTATAHALRASPAPVAEAPGFHWSRGPPVAV